MVGVQDFYTGKSVFITGSTGFMGKVLVEKLLRSTAVSSVYLLIRPKRGVLTQDRLKDTLDSKLFDGLRATAPERLTILRAIGGDITEENLGISDQDRKLLCENVSIVFHSAATVKFDEDLTKAVAMNVIAVLKMLDLCKKMKKLEALVHVSTAYANCDLKKVNEVVYPPPANPHDIIKLCQDDNAEMMNSPEVTAKLIGNRPNTYTFTKALAENILVTEGAGLPICIVRPSIVTASWREPVPGWVDNLNGPTGMIAGGLKGIIRTLRTEVQKKADIVPVDVPINLMICAAWRLGTGPPPPYIPVYNATSGAKPFKWGHFKTMGMNALYKCPSNQIFWMPGGSMKGSNLHNSICQLLFESIPAYLVDGLCLLTNNKRFMVKISKRMHKAGKTLEFFTTNEWDFARERVEELDSQLDEQDRMVFNFDMSDLDWQNYMDTYFKGVRQFIFKEPESTIEDSKSLLMKMYWLDIAVKVFFFLLCLHFILSRFDFGFELYTLFVALLSSVLPTF